MRIPRSNDCATIAARNSALCARRRSPTISIRGIGAATVAANVCLISILPSGHAAPHPTRETRCPCAATIRMRCRIASSRNAPERVGHCLTRMLPSAASACQSGRARKTCFPVRSASLLSRPDLAPPKPRSATEGMGGAEPPAATRSALFAREHGEDGEHRTFPAVSTVAHSAPVGGSGRRRSTYKRYVTEPVPHRTVVRCSGRPMPARASLRRSPRQTPS